jgi:hypothetical protein
MSRKSAAAIAAIVATLALFVGWYVIASDYDYSALSGTYVFHDGEVTSTLVLHSDRTFDQTLIRNGNTSQAVGGWRRIGEGGVTFSKEMLRLPGQQTYSDRFGTDPNGDRSADQEFGGHFQKFLGIYPFLNLDASPTPLTLHKRLLSLKNR